MKKKIIINIFNLFLIGGMLLLSSCEEESFLDRYPKDSPSEDVFFVDESSAKKAVVASYQPWTRSAAMYQRDLVIMFDAMTDDSQWRPSRAGSIQQSNWNITPTHGAINAYWTHAFQSINAANYAIDRIPTLLDKGLTQEKLDPYIAEAHFMRGFAYLFLVTFFGDVPLIDQPLSDFDEFSQPRSEKSDIYKQIIDDFTFAKSNLPEEWEGAYTGSANKATAAAYLAKAYLYKEDFPNAETAAREAVSIAEEAGYELIDDYESIFDINNEANPELLFYISYITDNEDFGTNSIVQRIVRDIVPELSHVHQGISGWGYALPQRDLYDAFEEDDPRRGYTIFSPGEIFGIYGSSDPFTYEHNIYDENGDEVSYERTYTAGDTVEYDYRWSPTGMNVKKMTYDISHLTNERWAGLDVPLMRMADLYLILAEALAEQGNNEALDWVNQVRSRPSVNMPDKTAADGDLVELVRHERRVELAMEGQRLWDLMRWNKVKDVFGDGTKVKRHFFSDYLTGEDAIGTKFDNPELDNYSGDDILFPIPQGEIDQNESINTNNPGY